MSDILKNAEKIEINGFDITTLGEEIREIVKTKSGDQKSDAVDETILENLSFATPEEIDILKGYFGLGKIDFLDENKIGKIKFIYKQSDEDLFKFLNEVGLKIGGKTLPDRLEKMYVYLVMLDQEKRVKENMENIKKELKFLEK